jgi:hypothetical protein
MVVMLPLDATSGSPAFTAQQTRQALSVLAGPAPAGRPLGARSGVRLGTPTTTAFLSGTGSTTWNVGAHSGVLDTQTAAAAGPYYYATDGSDTGAITAANASNPRIDILYVKVNDNVQDSSGLTSGQVLYLAGTAAASPTQPATPARGMAIARINVPTSGGGSPTVTWIAPTFYPDTNLIQTGVVANQTTATAGPGVTMGPYSFNFPIPFSANPVISISVISAPRAFFGLYQVATSTTGGSATFANFGTASMSGQVAGLSFMWTAIGLP